MELPEAKAQRRSTMPESQRFRRLDPYVAPPSATFEYFTSQRKQAESGITLDPKQHYAAIRVRLPDGAMMWVVTTEPVRALEKGGEIMFIAGIDPSSAQFLIDSGAEYIEDRK